MPGYLPNQITVLDPIYSLLYVFFCQYFWKKFEPTKGVYASSVLSVVQLQMFSMVLSKNQIHCIVQLQPLPHL